LHIIYKPFAIIQTKIVVMNRFVKVSTSRLKIQDGCIHAPGANFAVSIVYHEWCQWGTHSQGILFTLRSAEWTQALYSLYQHLFHEFSLVLIPFRRLSDSYHLTARAESSTGGIISL
jgi:hypothetical protein